MQLNTDTHTLTHTHTLTLTHTHITEMGQRSKWIFFQKMYPDRYKAHEKMLSVPNDWRNGNQNDNEVSAKITESEDPPKDLQRLNSARSRGKRNHSTLGADVNGWVWPRRKKAWRFLKTLNMELLMPWKPTPCLRSRKTKQFK